MKRALGILIVVAGLALLLSQTPFHLPPGGPRGTFTLPFEETGHPIALLVHSDAYGSAAPAPADLEWVNILTQVFGGCDVRRAELVAARPSILADRRLVVVPHATLARLDGAALDALQSGVAGGGVVLLEAPGDGLAPHFGLQLVQTSEPSRLAWPVKGSGFSMQGTILPAPSEDLAIRTRVERYQPAAPGPRGRALPALSPTGRPLVRNISHGRGDWRILSLHLGALAHDLRQGTRDPDAPDAGPAPPVHLASSLPPQVDHPWLDAWLDVLLLGEAGAQPLPALWPAPFLHDGWLLVTEVVDSSSPDAPAEDDGVTRFRGPGAPARVAAGWVATHPEADDHPLASVRRFGVGRFDLAIRRPALSRQRELLATTTGVVPGPFVLLRNGRWSPRPDDTWTELAGLDIRADVSFSPGPDGLGWRFGSGAAFRPLGASGGMVQRWEIPRMVDDLAGVPRSRLRRWIQQNARGGHGPIHLTLLPATPSDRLAAVRRLGDDARHHAARLPEFLDFWEERRSIHVRWERVADHTLVIDVSSPHPVAIDHALVIPVRWRGLTLRSWESTAQPVRSRLATSFGRPVRLIALNDLPAAITVHYRP